MTATQDNNGTVNLTQACVELGLVRVEPTLPAALDVRRGKGTVSVQKFSGTGRAVDIKAQLKAANPKISSKALGVKVGEVLRGEKPLREQLAVAWVQSRFQAGDVASHGEVTKSGSCLRMVKAPEPKIAAAVIPETKEGIAEQIAKLQAQLAKLNAAAQ
jgi:hypothetical protein